MKKKLMITLDEDLWDYMEKNFVNKSALIRALIRKHYTENSINFEELRGKSEKSEEM